jgi:branched-chain amino acid transport system substrate-binding protein
MRALSLALSAALALSLAGCAAAEEEPAGAGNGDIVVGASLELSGPTASIGSTYKKALDLKLKEINDSGVLKGRKLRLVVRDNRTDNNTSVSNVNQFAHNDKVTAIITGGCSACVAAAIPAITENKVPAIALASASAITNPVAQRRYVFKISPNPDQDATVIVDELKRRDVGTIGLLHVDNVYGQEGQKSVADGAAKAGIEVAADEQFGQADTNMAVQVSKIVAAKPDAVVVWAVMPAAGIIVKGLKDAKYPGPIYLDAGAGAELFVKGTGAAAEGTNMVFPRILAAGDLPAGAAQKKWVDAYQAAYGPPYSGFASFAGDALQVIVDAVNKTGGTDPEKIRAAIENTQLDGLSGALRFTPDNHSGLLPDALAVLTVRQGEWRLPAKP